MRLIIIDDEKLERIALSKMLHKEMPEIEVVGEGVNGRMAIQLAKELKPDIMMMDIKMPGIDGVEAVKEIRKFNKQIKFIMVSAFNTFEYAKEVMQQGVKEYVLKPSTKADVLAALKRVQIEIGEERIIESEQKHLKENLTRALSVIETEWLSSMLLDHIEDMNFDDWSRLLGIEIKSGYIILFSIQDNDAETSKENKRNLYSGIKHILKARTNQECILGPMVDQKIPVLVLSKSDHEKTRIKSQAIKLVRSVVNIFRGQYKNAKLYAGIGTPFDTIEQLSRSYHEAILALEQRNEDDVIFYAQSDSISSLPDFEKERELLEWIKLGDRYRTQQAVELYIEKEVDEFSGNLEKRLQELIIVVSRLIFDLGIHSEKSVTLSNCQTIDEMKRRARQYVMDSVDHVRAWRSSHVGGYLQKSKEYIEQNYEKNITLEEVADYVELSPFHFSKIFKERFGVTFIDYLTDLRIEKAKNEILHTNKSLKEICYNVGYKDPNYFSRVFKKKTGVSPTAYRSK